MGRLKASTHPSKRVVILGTVTANSKELGGKIPIPAPADLGDLSGFEAGFKDPVQARQGLQRQQALQHDHHPGAASPSARGHGDHLHVALPGLCGGHTVVPQHPQGLPDDLPLVSEKHHRRLRLVVANPDFAESGVHWSWGNRQKKDGQQFSQELSDKATDPETARRVWELSMKLVGL